jgi:hypothetical protein
MLLILLLLRRRLWRDQAPPGIADSNWLRV